MGSSSEYRLTKGRQSDRTTVQSTGTSHKIVRRAGGGADFSATYEDDGEVRSDLKVADQVPLDLSASIGIEGFWSFGTYEEEIEEVLGSTFAADASITGTDIAAVASGNKLTSTTSGKFDAVTQYEIVQVAGFATSGNNGFARATSIVTGASPELALDSTWLTLADEGVGPSVTITCGQYVREGTTQYYLTFEEKFASDDWQLWVAAVAQSMTYNRQNASKVSFNANYVIPAGISSTGLPGSATILSGSPTAATTSRIMSHKHVTVIREGTAATTLRTMSHSLTLERSKEGVGNHAVLGYEDFVNARLRISGQFDVYNEAAAQSLINKLRNDTPTALAWKEVDAAGNVYWWDVPQILYTGSTRNPGGPDTPVMLNLPFAAKMNSTYGFMFQLCKFPAA